MRTKQFYLKDAFKDLRQDAAATRYMANEPDMVPDYPGAEGPEDWHYVAPSRFKVWTRRTFPMLVVLFNRCCWLAANAMCQFTDHKWVDDSYGGSESGCMAGHCERCGHSFHTTLY